MWPLNLGCSNLPLYQFSQRSEGGQIFIAAVYTSIYPYLYITCIILVLTFWGLMYCIYYWEWIYLLYFNAVSTVLKHIYIIIVTVLIDCTHILNYVNIWYAKYLFDKNLFCENLFAKYLLWTTKYSTDTKYCIVLEYLVRIHLKEGILGGEHTPGALYEASRGGNLPLKLLLALLLLHLQRKAGPENSLCT